ncbi:MAG: hypothetical protein HKL96_02730 [Phycisphaerales bacterium]|nr:hypothetical protein [Phycisphaerales bacterium]
MVSRIRTRVIGTLLAAVASAAMVPTAVHADTLTWTFNSPTGTLGTSQVYTAMDSNPTGIRPTVTAYGFNFTSEVGTPAALYAKNSGSSEQGLGLVGAPDNEIDAINSDNQQYNGMIQVNLTNLISLAVAGNATITFGSIQGGDHAVLGDSGSPGQLGSQITTVGPTNSGVNSVTIPWADFSLSHPYLDVTATSGSSVLLRSIQISFVPSDATPEPASMAILGAAGLPLLLARRRKVQA